MRPATELAIALKDDDRLIGGGGLDGSNAAAAAEPALGYWLGREFWRQGYGREAVSAFVRYGFDVLGLPSISASTDPANAASQKVLLAAGLERVGEIDLRTPTNSGATRVPIFRMQSVL
jgi:RimJ/RimL family protein N-acetyltransferase